MSAAALPDVERTKLVKILGLLSSAHDGEVANAGKLADNLLRQLGLRWDDVIATAPAPARNPFDEAPQGRNPFHEAWRARGEAPWQCKAREVAGSMRVTEWERRFAKSLLDFPFLSGRQEACLDRAFQKCRSY